MTEVGLKEDNNNKQGRMEEDKQLHRRPQMMGQAREKEDETPENDEKCKQLRLENVHDINWTFHVL